MIFPFFLYIGLPFSPLCLETPSASCWAGGAADADVAAAAGTGAAAGAVGDLIGLIGATL